MNAKIAGKKEQATSVAIVSHVVPMGISATSARKGVEAVIRETSNGYFRGIRSSQEQYLHIPSL